MMDFLERWRTGEKNLLIGLRQWRQGTVLGLLYRYENIIKIDDILRRPFYSIQFFAEDFPVIRNFKKMQLNEDWTEMFEYSEDAGEFHITCPVFEEKLTIRCVDYSQVELWKKSFKIPKEIDPKTVRIYAGRCKIIITGGKSCRDTTTQIFKIQMRNQPGYTINNHQNRPTILWIPIKTSRWK